ncbi:MAG: hypothetical protein IIT95_00090 [Oscillospiraceae bacterium]|nr:hypothetical protein [Oscillospiraceae bacterium]
MAIVSLVLGIVGIALPAALASKSVIWAVLGLVLCIVGIVLGAKARKDPSQNKGVATAGMIVSIVGTVYCAYMVIWVIACYAAAQSIISQLQ